MIWKIYVVNSQKGTHCDFRWFSICFAWFGETSLNSRGIGMWLSFEQLSPRSLWRWEDQLMLFGRGSPHLLCAQQAVEMSTAKHQNTFRCSHLISPTDQSCLRSSEEQMKRLPSRKPTCMKRQAWAWSDLRLLCWKRIRLLIIHALPPQLLGCTESTHTANRHTD